MPRGARAWLRAVDEGILAEIAALSCAVRRTHDMSHHEEIYVLTPGSLLAMPMLSVDACEQPYFEQRQS